MLSCEKGKKTNQNSRILCLILHHLSSFHCFPAYYMLYCTLTIVLIFNLCVYISLADIIILDSAIQVVLISKQSQTRPNPAALHIPNDI